VGHRSGRPDLVAIHPDPRSARGTIESLSRAGVDGGAIVLLGRVEVVTAGRYGDRQTDLGSSLALGARILKGAGWGVVPGALFGVLLLALATTPTVIVVAAGAGGGAVLGAGIGVLLGLLAVPSMAGSWERTFAPLVPGGVAVGVRVEDARTERRAGRVLARRVTVAVRSVPDLDELPDGPLDPHALDR
jgi:hypothetical protein